MSGVKAALKAAKAALDANKYQDAIIQANMVLKVDSKNYHAYKIAHPLRLLVRLTLPPPVMYS